MLDFNTLSKLILLKNRFTPTHFTIGTFQIWGQDWPKYILRICKYVQRRRWKVIGWRKLLLKTDIFEINYNQFKTNLRGFQKSIFYFVSRDIITVKHLTLGLVKLVTLNLINKIQDYGRAICSTSLTVTRKWTVTPISFYEIIEFYQNQVLTLANSYVICWYSPSRNKMKNLDDNFNESAIKPIEFRPLRSKSDQLR